MNMSQHKYFESPDFLNNLKIRLYYLVFTLFSFELKVIVLTVEHPPTNSNLRVDEKLSFGNVMGKRQ